MNKHRTHFSMEIDVVFENEDNAKAFFIDGDWKNLFWSISDLRDLAMSIASAFHYAESRWDKNIKKHIKSIKGYGLFIRQQDGSYKTDDFTAEEGGGHICIAYEKVLDVVITETLDK